MSQIIGVSFNPANQLLPDEKTELKILEKYHVSYTNVLAIQPGEAIWVYEVIVNKLVMVLITTL